MSTVSPQDSRTWALSAHATALVGALVGGLPAFVGPLVVWLLRRDTDPFAAEHARQALNFNLSVLLYALAAFLLTVVTLGIAAIVLVPLGVIVGILYLVVTVMGTLAASRGSGFRYPLTIPFVR